MNCIIRIGENPGNKIIRYEPTYLDDYKKEMEEMEKLLKKDNVTITHCTHYLMYYANNLMMRNMVTKNESLPENLRNRFNLDPSKVKVTEVDYDASEKCIQDETGFIASNYFDELMMEIMDEFYVSLNYYIEPEEK